VDAENSQAENPQLSPFSLTASNSGEKFDIIQETLIGREVECAISIDSPHVSRYHAKIIVGATGTTIEDLNSSNGTYVNGKRIKEPTYISVGDEIRFDSLSFRLTSKEAGTSDATVILSQESTASASSTGPAETLKTSALQTPADSATADEQDADYTRMLSNDQINNIAEINKKAHKLSDSGSGPRFVATTAPIRGKIFELEADNPDNLWRFGRSRDCEIFVSAPSISRKHGTIRKENGRFHFASEQGKTLRVNGVEKQDAMLKHNDQIQIGPIEFIFRLDEQKKPANNMIPEPSPDNSLQRTLILAGAGALLLIVLVYLLVFQG